jgi:hypothetical protein
MTILPTSFSTIDGGGEPEPIGRAETLLQHHRDTRGVNTIVRNEIGTPVRRKQLGDYFKAPGRDYRASYPDIRNL